MTIKPASSPQENFRRIVLENIEDPVSYERMTTAVTIVPCGHIFNEDTVIDCLARNKLCPNDRQPIDKYVPNFQMRALAEAAEIEEREILKEEEILQKAKELFSEAKKLSDGEKYEEAASLLLKVLQLSPLYEKAKVYLDFCLSRSSQPLPHQAPPPKPNPSAEKTPAEAVLYYDKGAKLHEQKKYEEAISAFITALTLCPQYEKAERHLEFTLECQDRAVAAGSCEITPSTSSTTDPRFNPFSAENTERLSEVLPEASSGPSMNSYSILPLIPSSALPIISSAPEEHKSSDATVQHLDLQVFLYYQNKARQEGLAKDQYRLGRFYAMGQGVPRDYNEAFRWFKQAADQGYDNAQLTLGLCYYNGYGIVQNENEAFRWFQKAADQNCADALLQLKHGSDQGIASAQFYLGLYYYNGLGIALDYDEAFRLFEKAAEQDHAQAQFYLGLCYHKHLGPPSKLSDISINSSEAFKWFKKAAEQGHTDAQIRLKNFAQDGHIEAQYYLGECHYSGSKAVRNPETAFQWFKKAAEQGHSNAQWRLGYSYFYGEGVAQDIPAAFNWFRKAAAQNHADAHTKLRDCASEGHAEAQYYLGEYYTSGYKVAKNSGMASYWLKKAADQGHAQAKNLLDSLANSSLSPTPFPAKPPAVSGKSVDPSPVLQNERLSVEGEKEYRRGLELQRNPQTEDQLEIAFLQFQNAAKVGHDQSQYSLGMCYYHGKGTPQNLKAAFQWLKKAADQGHAEAQYYIGECYFHRYGVRKQSFDQAYEWFEKAADQNHADAHNKLIIYARQEGHPVPQCYLGKCYYYGSKVDKNFDEAFQWFKKAADQGHVEAQYYLGECYYHGHGVTQSFHEAFRWWFEKAIYINHADVQEKLWICAREGQADAQYYLGERLYYGSKEAISFDEAFQWFKKAADQGHAGARYRLGICYFNENGVARNYDEAFKLFQQAADQGDARARSMLEHHFKPSGSINLSPPLQPRQYPEAANNPALVMPAPTQPKQASTELPIQPIDFSGENDYRKGLSLVKEEKLKEAFDCFHLAAQQNHVAAQYELGNCFYDRGIKLGHKHHYDEAIKWYKRAADGGNAQARNMLEQFFSQPHYRVFSPSPSATTIPVQHMNPPMRKQISDSSLIIPLTEMKQGPVNSSSVVVPVIPPRPINPTVPAMPMPPVPKSSGTVTPMSPPLAIPPISTIHKPIGAMIQPINPAPSIQAAPLPSRIFPPNIPHRNSYPYWIFKSDLMPVNNPALSQIPPAALTLSRSIKSESLVSALFFHPFNCLVTGSATGRVNILDPISGNCLHTIHIPAQGISSLMVIHPIIFAIGSNEPMIRGGFIAAGKPCPLVLQGHSDPINSLLSYESNTLISVSTDLSFSTIKIWKENVCVQTFKAASKRTTAMLRLFDGRLACADEDSTIKLWDLSTGQCTLLKGHEGKVCDLGLSKNGTLISASADGTLRFWDVSKEICFRKVDAHSGSIGSLTIRFDDILASGSQDGTIKLWDMTTGDSIRTINIGSPVMRLTHDPLTGALFCGTTDSIQIWR